MSERLRAQYRNTAQAASNVENKINYLQTADSWLQKIHDMTGRMAELAIMANDGTKSQIDRDNLQQEFAQMQKEIQRITSGATASGKFNGLYLFRGGNGVPILDSDLVEGNTDSHFTVRRLSGSGTLSDEYAATYDYDQRLWTVRNTTSNYDVGTFTAEPREGGSVIFNESGTVFELKLDAPNTGGYLPNACIKFSETALGAAQLGEIAFSSSATQGSADLSSSGDGSAISRSSWSATYTGSAWELRNLTTGIVERTTTAAVNAAVTMPFIGGFDGFNLQLNTPANGTCYSVGDVFTWSNQDGTVGTPIFQNAPATNGSATVTKLGDGMNVASDSYTATYDGVAQEWTIIDAAGSTAGTISADPFSGGSLTLNGGNGSRFTIQPPSTGGYSSGDSFTWTNAAMGTDYIVSNNVRLQVGPDSNQMFVEDQLNLESQNFDIIGSYSTYSYGSLNMTLLGSTLHSVRWGSLLSGQHLSISQQSSAQGAVAKLNIGIDHISSLRSVLGAEMNRMEQTLGGLRNYEEATRATESRIRDVDVAQETTQYSTYQILVQVGQAMLAQANALPQGVLQMLG